MSEKNAMANPCRKLAGPCFCKLCHRRAGVTEPQSKRDERYRKYLRSLTKIRHVPGFGPVLTWGYEIDGAEDKAE